MPGSFSNQASVLQDIWPCTKCPQRHLVPDSLQDSTIEPHSNWMDVIFLVILEESWISHWFLFFLIMKFGKCYSEVDEQLLLSIYWPDYQHCIPSSVNSFSDTDWILLVSCEVGSCICVWPPRIWGISCSWLGCSSFHTSRTSQHEPNVSVHILGQGQISRTFQHRPNVR